MRKLWIAAVLTAALMAGGGRPACAQTIDTTPPNFNPIGFGFGDPFIATMGQTLTPTAAQNRLYDFTFLAAPLRNPDDVTFRSYVSEWDPVGFHAVGPILFQSDVMTTVGKPGAPQFTEFNAVLPGGLALTPGAHYVLFVSTIGYQDSLAGMANFGLRNDDPYPGGEFVWNSATGSLADLTQSSWTTMARVDAAFRANFNASSVVPESGSFLLLMAGLPGLFAAIGRLRRR